MAFDRVESQDLFAALSTVPIHNALRINPLAVELAGCDSLFFLPMLTTTGLSVLQPQNYSHRVVKSRPRSAESLNLSA